MHTWSGVPESTRSYARLAELSRDFSAELTQVCEVSSSAVSDLGDLQVGLCQPKGYLTTTYLPEVCCATVVNN